MKLLNSFGRMATGRGALAIAQAIALIMLARMVGPSEFGVFSVIFTFQATVVAFLEFGISRYVLRGVALGDERQIPACFYLNNLLSVLAFVICLIPVFVVSSSGVLRFFYALLGLAFIFERIVEIRISLLMGRGNTARPAGALLTRSIAFLGIFLVIDTVVNPIVAYVLARLLGGVGSALIVGGWQLKDFRPHPGIRNVIRELAPMGGASSIGSLSGFDVVILNFVVAPIEAGYYAAAIKLVSPISLAVVTFALVLLPHTANADLKTMRRIAGRFWTLLSLGAVLAVLASSWGEDLIVLLFGASFSGGGAVMSGVLLGLPALVLSPLLETTLQSRRDDRFVFYVILLSIFTRLSMLFVLGFLYGVVAAVYSVSLVLWISTVILSARLSQLSSPRN